MSKMGLREFNLMAMENAVVLEVGRKMLDTAASAISPDGKPTIGAKLLACEGLIGLANYFEVEDTHGLAVAASASLVRDLVGLVGRDKLDLVLKSKAPAKPVENTSKGGENAKAMPGNVVLKPEDKARLEKAKDSPFNKMLERANKALNNTATGGENTAPVKPEQEAAKYWPMKFEELTNKGGKLRECPLCHKDVKKKNFVQVRSTAQPEYNGLLVCLDCNKQFVKDDKAEAAQKKKIEEAKAAEAESDKLSKEIAEAKQAYEQAEHALDVTKATAKASKELPEAAKQAMIEAVEKDVALKSGKLDALTNRLKVLTDQHGITVANQTGKAGAIAAAAKQASKK